MPGFPERTATLRDGTRVLLRGARPEDAPLVRLGFASCRPLAPVPIPAGDAAPVRHDLSFLADAPTENESSARSTSGAAARAGRPCALRPAAGALRRRGGGGHGDRQPPAAGGSARSFSAASRGRRKASGSGLRRPRPAAQPAMRRLLEDLGADRRGPGRRVPVPDAAETRRADYPATPAGRCVPRGLRARRGRLTGRAEARPTLRRT
jgi:pyruvate/2-oxoglutarate dehydrogenase complex dihydrolipoamide acyltransferase (E2) component